MSDNKRQSWMTPAWLLSELTAHGWAGPWDFDAFADDDGENAVTIRSAGAYVTDLRSQLLEHVQNGGPEAERESIVNPWASAATPRAWRGHVFANPPFKLWGRVVPKAVELVESGAVLSVTLVGLDDRSTKAVRLLSRCEAENRAGKAHAVRVPIEGRWGFEPPAGVTESTATRAHAVWVLRRVLGRPEAA